MVQVKTVKLIKNGSEGDGSASQPKKRRTKVHQEGEPAAAAENPDKSGSLVVAAGIMNLNSHIYLSSKF